MPNKLKKQQVSETRDQISEVKVKPAKFIIEYKLFYHYCMN